MPTAHSHPSRAAMQSMRCNSLAIVKDEPPRIYEDEEYMNTQQIENFLSLCTCAWRILARKGVVPAGAAPAPSHPQRCRSSHAAMLRCGLLLLRCCCSDPASCACCWLDDSHSGFAQSLHVY